MVVWFILTFLLAFSLSGLHQGYMRASDEGHAVVAALYEAGQVAVGALSLVLAVKVSLFLLLADVVGHPTGTYLTVRFFSKDKHAHD